MAKRHPASDTEKPHHIGHRARMRQRVWNHGAASLADYELLEMLLFTVIPRRDTKPLAKALIERFGSLVGIFQASATTLAECGLSPRAVALLQVPSLCAHALRAKEQQEKPFLGDWKTVKSYLHHLLKNQDMSGGYVLYLDSKNHLLCHERLPDGAVLPENHQAVATRLLELHATALILIHHHPEHPMTTLAQKARALQRALQPISITLHDVVVTGDGWISSLYQEGLL